MDRQFNKSCTVCFSGHRAIQESEFFLLQKKIQKAVHCAYHNGYRVYICGGARGFDTLAALEVIRLRKTLGDIRLVIAVPCLSQADRWPEKDRIIYQSILYQADEKIVLSDFYYSGCMQNRNRFMVDSSSLCICYMTRFEGGTWYTVRYAIRNGLLLQNLAMPEETVLKERPWKYTYIYPSAQKNVSIARLFHFNQQMFRKMNTLQLSFVKLKQENLLRMNR